MFDVVLCAIDWGIILHSESCAFDAFMSFFHKGIDTSFPIKTIKKNLTRSHTILGWYNSELMSLKNDVTFYQNFLEWSLHYNIKIHEGRTLYNTAKYKHKMGLKDAKIYTMLGKTVNNIHLQSLNIKRIIILPLVTLF